MRHHLLKRNYDLGFDSFNNIVLISKNNNCIRRTRPTEFDKWQEFVEKLIEEGHSFSESAKESLKEIGVNIKSWES